MGALDEAFWHFPGEKGGRTIWRWYADRGRGGVKPSGDGMPTGGEGGLNILKSLTTSFMDGPLILPCTNRVRFSIFIFRKGKSIQSFLVVNSGYVGFTVGLTKFIRNLAKIR